MEKTDKILLGLGAFMVIGGSLFVFMLFKDPNMFLAQQQTNKETSVSGEEVVVNYSKEEGFVPNTITISPGQKVTFKTNRTDQPMYVASNPHPMHTDYPEFETMVILGGGYPEIGDNLKFTFTKPGTWKYHDHADPAQNGTVVVR